MSKVSKPPKASKTSTPAVRVPPRRETIEVELDWVELREREPSESDKKAARKSASNPPQIPGTAVVVPPLPTAGPKSESNEVARSHEREGKGAPPRRHTMEVQMDWVELKDIEPAAASAGSKGAKASFRPPSPGEILKAKKPRAAPIPREEEDDGPPPEKTRGKKK